MRRFIRYVLFIALAAGAGSCEDLPFGPEGGLTREMLEDTWKVEETLSGYKSAEEIYWVEVSPHPYDTSRVVIFNFYNIGADAEAVLTGGMNLLLPEQILEGGYKVSGSGEARGNRANQIIWTYTVDDGSGMPERITAVYTRLTF